MPIVTFTISHRTSQTVLTECEHFEHMTSESFWLAQHDVFYRHLTNHNTPPGSPLPSTTLFMPLWHSWWPPLSCPWSYVWMKIPVKKRTFNLLHYWYIPRHHPFFSWHNKRLNWLPKVYTELAQHSTVANHCYHPFTHLSYLVLKSQDVFNYLHTSPSLNPFWKVTDQTHQPSRKSRLVHWTEPVEQNKWKVAPTQEHAIPIWKPAKRIWNRTRRYCGQLEPFACWSY